MNIRPAWAEIDLTAIAHNIKELRRVTEPHARVMAVVKANAYGHGAVPVSRTVLANGADYLGVAILDEARELREAGIEAPVLVLGYTPPEQAEETVQLDLAQTVYTFEAAEALSQAAVKIGKTVRVHVKFDTGMGRLGFAGNTDIPGEIYRIARLPGLQIEGIMTHFAVADAIDKNYTYQQFKMFEQIADRLKEAGINNVIRHAANSAAIIDMPELHLDMVRAGISIYGLYPSNQVKKERVSLRPAMSLKARIAHIKKVPPGTGISYGRTFITERDTIVATVPVGYADGYTRLLSNKSHVLAGGKRVPVIGTVCMDQFMIDVSGIQDIRTGDEIVLVGKQGENRVTADELADLLGTINYEIVCAISERVPRIYYEVQ